MKIIAYPNKTLTTTAKKHENIDEDTIEKISEMFQVMEDHDGAGLAAPQVGWGTRLFIINPVAISRAINKTIPQEKVFINPEILSKSGSDVDEEACLSVPLIMGRVKRAKTIKIQATGLDGNQFEFETEGLHARVLQHEYDHLNGLLFTTKVLPSERNRINKHLSRLRKIGEKQTEALANIARQSKEDDRRTTESES